MDLTPAQRKAILKKFQGYVYMETKGYNVYGRRSLKSGQPLKARLHYVVHRDGRPMAAFSGEDDAVAYCEMMNKRAAQ